MTGVQTCALPICAQVGLQVVFTEGTQDFLAAASIVFYAGVLVLVEFDPGWGMARHAVFPGAKPEENNLELVFAGIVDQVAEQSEVVFSFLGFEQFPIDGDEHRVEVRGLEFGPNGLHVLDGGSGGVAEFTTQHDERFALYNKLGDIALLAKGGDRILCNRKLEFGYCAEQQEVS